ncbi:MAG: nitroreductase [Bacteroidales bacterium]|nr:nitroreductase [Bacteroidales bacterium]
MKLVKSLLSVILASAMISCAPATENQNEKKENAMNPVIENIMARRSIRQYKPEPVKRETMDVILNCGINAPSGMNRQSWEVKVLDKPEVISKLKAAMVSANPNSEPENVEGCFRGAPTLVFVAADQGYDFSTIDCGLLSQNIMLSAWSLGVGSVCLGSPIRFLMESPEALAILGFSEGYKPVICIGLGYANESPEAKPRDISKVKYVE